MKQLFALCALALSLYSCTDAPQAETPSAPTVQVPSGDLMFYVVADVGRNGHYKQKDVAESMGRWSDERRPAFVVSAGDCFHMLGVQSTADPIWLTNYEWVYSHPNLHCLWYPVLGNHEYQGNTQAVIDYSSVSRRWEMPSRYYTTLHKAGKATVRIVHIDTAPLIEKYRKGTDKYPDVAHQDHQKQLRWIDSVLAASEADWDIVVGHHPVLSEDTKDSLEQAEMLIHIAPLLAKHRVDAYFSGHIHTFQHIKDSTRHTHFVVAPSGSLGRPKLTNAHTQFASEQEGFIICSAGTDSLSFSCINFEGQALYSYSLVK
jgi:hypothetical protein